MAVSITYGVMVGGPNIDNRSPSNNHVHACGREYYGAIGIWVGFAKNTGISHNLVHDLPYTGVSVGWEWGMYPNTRIKNNIEIQKNKISGFLFFE